MTPGCPPVIFGPKGQRSWAPGAQMCQTGSRNIFKNQRSHRAHIWYTDSQWTLDVPMWVLATELDVYGPQGAKCFDLEVALSGSKCSRNAGSLYVLWEFRFDPFDPLGPMNFDQFKNKKHIRVRREISNILRPNTIYFGQDLTIFMLIS